MSVLSMSAGLLFVLGIYIGALLADRLAERYTFGFSSVISTLYFVSS